MDDKTISESCDDHDKVEHLPPQPQEPDSSECCGEGCIPCVYDIYNQELTLWQAECDRIKHGGSRSYSNNDILSPESYTKFELVEIQSVTSECNLYTFTIPGCNRINLGLCQHLILRCESSERVITRPYTPISHPNTRGSLQFIIKLYPDGVMSEYIRNWTIGDMIEWRGPFGNFKYKPNSYKHMVMLTAGTGIAPIVQLIRHILDNEDDDTILHLVYACKNYNSILCKDLLDEWAGFWNFSVVYVLSQDEEVDSTTHRYGDVVVYGRLTSDLVKQYTLDYRDNLLVLICGTRLFDKNMLNYLKTMGISKDNIFKF